MTVGLPATFFTPGGRGRTKLFCVVRHSPSGCYGSVGGKAWALPSDAVVPEVTGTQ